VDFQEAGLRVSLYQVAKLEDLVDREALLRDDLVPDPPYWAHLWIGATALARFLARSVELEGKKVLDLGCGLGLTGLVAAAKGAEVWLADREPAALEFVRASARLSGLEQVRTLALDFTTGSLPERFDAIFGAEIIYDPGAYSPLADFLEQHLAADGALYLTDAFRSDAESFFAELRRRGFAGERQPWREPEDGRLQGLFLWTFRRAPGSRRDQAG
jgi:predicted nicotinamide N-methyase